MPNAVPEHKTPIQWAALVATAALLWGVIWAVGSQFRDYMRVDTKQLVGELVAAHAADANANRGKFFQEVESKADNAVGRIGTLESNCAVVQSRLLGYEAQLSTLDRWRGNCSERMASVTQYMDSDEKDIQELRKTVSELQAFVQSMRWRQ